MYFKGTQDAPGLTGRGEISDPAIRRYGGGGGGEGRTPPSNIEVEPMPEADLLSRG